MEATNPTGRPETAPQAFGRVFAGMTGTAPDEQEAVTPAEEPIEDEDIVLEASDEEGEHGEQAEESSDEELEAPAGDTFTIVAGGQEFERTLDELKSDASKGLFFTQEMQKLRAAEREFHQQRDVALAEVRQQRDAYAQVLPQLQAALDTLGASPPDTELARTNPAEYTRLKAEYDAVASQRQAVAQEQERIAREQQEEYQQAMKARMQQSYQQIMAAIPHWQTDEKERVAEQAEMRSIAQEFGYTPQEIQALDQGMDARAVLILHELMTHRRNAAKGRKRVATSKKVVTPGAARTKGASKKVGYQKRKERALQTGRGRDRAIGSLLGELVVPSPE